MQELYDFWEVCMVKGAKQTGGETLCDMDPTLTHELWLTWDKRRMRGGNYMKPYLFNMVTGDLQYDWSLKREDNQ